MEEDLIFNREPRVDRKKVIPGIRVQNLTESNLSPGVLPGFHRVQGPEQAQTTLFGAFLAGSPIDVVAAGFSCVHDSLLSSPKAPSGAVNRVSAWD
jgi:hypothetical protein